MRAFRKLSLKYHPDRMVNATEEEKEWASRKLQAVVEAKNIIMDHRKQNRP
jgi:DnaJ-class molecular chaperone